MASFRLASAFARGAGPYVGWLELVGTLEGLLTGERGRELLARDGLLLVMMIMFGRVYGAVMAALIFALCTWTKLPFMQSIVFTIVMLAVLGLARRQILAFTSRITERAAAIQVRLRSRFARKPAER